MLNPILLDRYSRLLATRLIERNQLFPVEIRQITNKLAARGMLHSSVHVSQQHQAHIRELEIRSILAWESLVRAHRILGAVITPETRADFKAELARYINQFCVELSDSLRGHTQRFTANMDTSLENARDQQIDKHNIEIDLYLDTLMNNNSNTPSNSPQYNFYGSVGAVQTGANAQANVVQNLGAEDRAALAQAIGLVKEALQHTGDLAERQREELLEISAECEAQLSSSAPNNTKLLNMFMVLGTTIQSIASAQPAYQALKIALLPLGVTLP